MKPKSSSKKCLFKPFYYAVFALLFSQIIWAQCPTVGNTNITTCAFDGTNITKVSDLITLAGVSGGNPNVVWYDSLTGGNNIPDINTLTDGVYYLDTDLGECPARIAVTVNVDAEGDLFDTLGDLNRKCFGVTLSEVENGFTSIGDDILWYENSSSIVPLSENTQVFIETDFYISYEENGCESQKSLFTIALRESEPTEFKNETPNPFCLLPGENLTVADLNQYVINTSPGSAITWYDTENDANTDYLGDNNSSNNPLLSTEMVIDGEDYWAVIESSPCSSSPGVIVPNLEIQPQTGTPNPVGPFCETEGNNGTLPTEDLTTMLSGTVDTGGEWTETSGTSELSDSSDTIIDIQNIYNTLGVGSYSFTYTVTNGTDPETCISETTITIIIEPVLVAGTALPPVTICENNLTSNFDLFTLLIGNDLGGDWSDNTSTGALSGSNLDLTAITTPYNPSGYDFTYSINNGTTCPVDTEIVTIIITEAPELVINSPENFCLNDTSVGTINLSTYLTTDSSGGTGSWTDTNTTGALTIPDTIDVTILQGLGEGSYAFNYLVDNGDGCTEEINMIIVIDPENEAGIANNITICETNIVNNFDLFTLLTDNDLGGTWTDNTPTGALSGNIIDLTAVSTPYNPSGYQFTYTASNATCPDDTATVTIIITETPELVINSPENFCLNDTSVGTINLSTYLTTDSSGGTGSWTDTNTTGALTIPDTIDVTILQGLGEGSYAFNYLVDNGDGCTEEINMIIVIDPENEAGIANNITICETNIVTNFDLLTLLTDNDLGGTWTDNTPTGALSGNIIDLTAVATPYNPSGYQFTYTASNATCPDDTATVTIIITETPEAGTNQSINICISATTPSSEDLFSILTDEDAGGNWTDVSSSGALSLPSTVDISVLQGLGAATYTYEYTIDNGDGCIDSAQVNIVIEDEPDPINETIDICLTDINNGIFPFTNLDSFVITPNNPLNIDWTANTGTPNTTITNSQNGTIDWAEIILNTTSGTTTSFTYLASSTTSIDCNPDVGSIIINVIDIPAPNYTGTSSYCPATGIITIQDIINDFSSTLGGSINLYDAAIGGVLQDPFTELSPNTYTFYAAEQDTNGVGCESNPRTEIVITVNENSDAGEAGNFSQCTTDSTTINLFTLLNGNPDSGGTWAGPTVTSGGDLGTLDPTLLTVGDNIFTYTVTGIAPCLNASQTVTITIDPLPNAGTDGPIQNLCSTDPSINLYDLLTGSPDSGGTWTGATANGDLGTINPSELSEGDNVFIYSVSNACGISNPSSQIVVNITLTPNLVNPGNRIVCDSFDLSTLTIDGANLSGNQNYYDAPNGGGTILTTITSTTIVYLYDETNPTSCSNEEIFTVTITNTPEIDAITPAAVCDSFRFPVITGTNLNSPSYNTLADGSGVSYLEGEIYTPVNTGIYSFFMIDLNGDCTEQESFSVQINKSPNAGTDNLTASSCISETDFDLTTLLGVNTDTNGTWSPALTSGTNIFSPDDDGANTYTYTVTGTLPCTDSVAILTITIINPGNPSVSDQSFCLIDAPTVADLIATGTSLAWYDNENGTTPLLNTDSLVDGEDYWVTQNNGCESLKFSMIATINDPGIPVLETNGNQFCVIDNPTIADLEIQIINDNNYSIIWYDSLTDGNTINQNTSLIEGETYYVSFSNQSNLCVSADRLPITANLTNCDDEDFVIPEAFSPNGDGQNDTFSISNIGVLYPNYSIEIYNRYGNVVHKGNINTSDFDGKSNQNSFITNDVLPVGVYYYIIEFNNNAKKPIQGYLYLSR